MSITTTKDGVLHELTEVTANVGGVLYSLDTVTVNNSGVLREVFSKGEDEPAVELPADFSFSGSNNTRSEYFTSPNCKAEITFTVKLNNLSTTDSGVASVVLETSGVHYCSVSLNSSNRWTQTITETIEISQGSHRFIISGGGGGANGGTTILGTVIVKFKTV